MTPSDIIRAWKDPHYRAGLSGDPAGAAPGSSRWRHRAAGADAACGVAPPGLPRQVRPQSGRTDR